MSGPIRHMSWVRAAGGFLFGLAISGGAAAIASYAGGALSVDVVAMAVALGLASGLIPLIYAHAAITGDAARVVDFIGMIGAAGDPQRPLEPIGLPEDSPLSSIAQSCIELASRLRNGTTQLAASAARLKRTVEGLVGDMHNASDGTSRQIGVAESAAAALAALASDVMDAAQRSEETARIAQAACRHSSRGAEIVEEASAEIERIARTVEQSAQVVAELGERSKNISGIVKVIHDIADQTNLLALNAAIEAARAGEQGRGFAVVADEVRKLAERTTAATSEIGKMIADIQAETGSAIATIRVGSAQANNGSMLARQAAESLKSINSGAQDTLDKVSAIANTMAQQSDKTQVITGHIHDVIDSTRRQREFAREALSKVNNLGLLSRDFEQLGVLTSGSERPLAS
ncbi:MAG TPA: methyl-accepting chemotaxis protein [Rhodocyclaceae bacterium]|nr:methyl-accepting chemotaxis protein [Rhodocyclaceae bacterium]